MITSLVTSVGFPIVACVAMGYYVKYQSDINREEVKEMRADHAAEVNKMAEALNNNTIALQRLCDKLEG